MNIIQSLAEEAEETRRALRKKSYPGRIVGLGCTSSGKNFFQLTVIEGRGPDDTGNRIYTGTANQEHEGKVLTAIFDPKRLPKDAKTDLLLYTAMMHRRVDRGNTLYMGTNGHQTEQLFHQMTVQRHPFAVAIEEVKDRDYEPDSSNTPRINASLQRWGEDHYRADLSIARKEKGSDACRRTVHSLGTLEAGFIHCLSTYVDDAKPLVSYTGDPMVLPIVGENGDEVATELWQMLDPKHLVALVVKIIPVNVDHAPYIRMINKHHPDGDGGWGIKVPAPLSVELDSDDGPGLFDGLSVASATVGGPPVLSPPREPVGAH